MTEQVKEHRVSFAKREGAGTTTAVVTPPPPAAVSTEAAPTTSIDNAAPAGATQTCGLAAPQTNAETGL